MIQVFEKEIKGSKYSVTQFTARRALKLQTRLMKMFGPFLVEMFEKRPSTAFQMLASSISEQALDECVVELLSSTRKEGHELTPQIIDIEFAGDLGALIDVLAFVLKVNYENFFPALLAILPEAAESKKTEAVQQPSEALKMVFPRK
jgi:hypothetical protein